MLMQIREILDTFHQAEAACAAEVEKVHNPMLHEEVLLEPTSAHHMHARHPRQEQNADTHVAQPQEVI